MNVIIILVFCLLIDNSLRSLCLFIIESKIFHFIEVNVYLYNININKSIFI